MPRISEFYGIAIEMYHDDHEPPHFHVKYGEHMAAIDIATLAIRRGRLPPRAQRMVTEWAQLHQEELRANWKLVRELRPLAPIAPLD